MWRAISIPPELRARAKHVPRASFAVHDAGPLMGLWTSPYDFVEPDEASLTCPENNGTSLWGSRAAVLGAYQYSQIIETAWSRFELWTEEGCSLDVLEAEVKKEVAARVEAWVRLAKQSDGTTEVALDWGAKIVWMLAEEWDIRCDGGIEKYREERKSSRLPWQQMMKQTMGLFNQESS